jgi:predicted ArsR family transcriptional regulator
VIRMGPLLYADVIRLLIDGPITQQDIIDETGLHKFTIRDYLKALHKRKLIHIAVWSMTGPRRHRVAHWMWGRGTDARRPPRIPSSTRAAHYRQRKAARELQATVNSIVRQP